MGDHLATIPLVLEEFLYRLYGQPGGPAGPRGLPLPGPAASAAPQPLPLGRLCRPPAGGHHPPQPRLRPGIPPRWRWPQDFIQDLVRWARALAWMPGPAEVSWAELALDYEVFVGRALPAFPDHRLRGTRLPLGERAQVLRKAVGLAERHLAAGTAAEPLTPAPGGPRVRGAFGPLVLRGAPRGDVAAYAPGNALPGLGARSAWSMGHRALGAEAWAGGISHCSRATRDTPTPRWAHAVRGTCPGSRRDVRYLSLSTGARERPRCPRGRGGPARPPRPSRTWAPRRRTGRGPSQNDGHPPLLGIGARWPQAPEALGARPPG